MCGQGWRGGGGGGGGEGGVHIPRYISDSLSWVKVTGRVCRLEPMASLKSDALNLECLSNFTLPSR